jgi:hypothetical protein
VVSRMFRGAVMHLYRLGENNRIYSFRVYSGLLKRNN